MTVILILLALAQLALGWWIGDTLRQCLDVLRLLAAQGSERRGWEKK